MFKCVVRILYSYVLATYIRAFSASASFPEARE
jgi:hypothetical protein